jgi:hypothetical protein
VSSTALAANAEQLEVRMRDLILAGAIEPEETVRYVARPGLRALPAGTGIALSFVGAQLLLFTFFLWAIWWPFPSSTAGWIFSVTMTLGLVGLAAGIVWLLLRGNWPIAIGIARSPFIRLTVTDRRVIWSLPWNREPLMEIGCDRIRGGTLGSVDSHGRGNAAILLMPGDYHGDAAGYIHIDRLPDAAGFVEALRRLR